MILFKDLSTTLDIASATPKEWAGGSGVMSVAGVPDGLVVNLYANIDDVGYSIVQSTSFTEAGQLIFELPMCVLKAVVTGVSGVSSSISCTVSGFLDR
jgi:hypothetical protein